MAGIGGSYNSSESDSLTGRSENFDSGYRDVSRMGQGVMGEQRDALGQMYNKMGAEQGRYMGQNPTLDTASIQHSNAVRDQAIPQWQRQMEGGAYANLGMGDRLQQSLDQSMNNPSQTAQMNARIMGGGGYNDYAQAMKGEILQDANSINQQNMMNNDARAAASGMSGGSRHGLAQSMDARNVNNAAQNAMTNIGYQTFDKNLDRNMDIANMADANNLARQQMMAGMVDKRNNTMSQGIDNSQQLQNLGLTQYAPQLIGYQGMQDYAKALGAPTVLTEGGQDNSGFSRGQNYYVSDASGDSSGFGAEIGF